MRISLITVTYNSEAYLEDTFKSVLRQTNPDFEYIVVDGDSKDSTVEIIKRYEPLFAGRMHWISEPDGGMYDALNKGIKIATGDIVGILNSDDFFHSGDIIERVSKAFEDNPDIGAVFGDVRIVKQNDINHLVRHYSSKSWKPWKLRFGFMPAHPSYYTYRENFEKHGSYKLDYEISADFELIARHLYLNKVPYKYLPLDFLTMRMGGKSTRGFRSFWVLSKEDARGCRENGISTCVPLMLLRGFFKVLDVFKSLIKR